MSMRLVRAAVSLVGEGFDLFTEKPRIAGLPFVYDRDWELHHNEQRTEKSDPHPSASESILVKKHAPKRQQSARKIFYMRVGKGADARLARVSVDLETRQIDRMYTTSWLLGNDHQGSGAIGVGFLSSLPVLIFSPALFAVHRYYVRQEERRQLTRHGAAILDGLKGQLNPEEEALLREAFTNDWRLESAARNRQFR